MFSNEKWHAEDGISAVAVSESELLQQRIGETGKAKQGGVVKQSRKEMKREKARQTELTQAAAVRREDA